MLSCGKKGGNYSKWYICVDNSDYVGFVRGKLLGGLFNDFRMDFFSYKFIHAILTNSLVLNLVVFYVLL